MEIIPGLSDEIGRECLIRVPLTSHYKLALVCKRWKSIACSPLFYQERKRFGMSQELVILHCWDEETETDKSCRIKLHDPLQNSCEILPPFPSEFPYFSDYLHCVPFNHKLFVMGLVTDFTFHRAVVIYDFTSGRWKQGPDLPDCRYNFCCSVDSAKGLIYIAGGCDIGEKELCTAAVYDVEEEQWEYLPPMIWTICWSYSVFTDDKLFVMDHVEERVQAYDPNTRQWSAISTSYDDSIQPLSVEFGRIYFNFHGEIIDWNYLDNQLRVALTL